MRRTARFPLAGYTFSRVRYAAARKRSLQPTEKASWQLGYASERAAACRPPSPPDAEYSRERAISTIDCSTIGLFTSMVFRSGAATGRAAPDEGRRGSCSRFAGDVVDVPELERRADGIRTEKRNYSPELSLVPPSTDGHGGFAFAVVRKTIDARRVLLDQTSWVSSEHCTVSH